MMDKLHIEKHIEFIQKLDEQKDTLEYWYSEHLKLSAIYWAITALALMGKQDALPRDGIIEFVLNCYDEKSGGFGGSPNHDGHLLYTLSGIQILLTLDALTTFPHINKVIDFVLKLQDPITGAFNGDEYGEQDTRFTYAALSTLALLNALPKANLPLATKAILDCWNGDGGFGAQPNAESHAGQIFCCVSALAILGQLDLIEDNKDSLCWWLSERQLPNGGLNGRPEKLEDVCYSWWVLSSLSTLNCIHWIDQNALIQFILNCQDLNQGGFSDRPGHMGDVFHTLFGLAGLSLLGYKELKSIDPVFCMPKELIIKLNLNKV